MLPSFIPKQLKLVPNKLNCKSAGSNILTTLLDDHTLIHKKKIKLIYFISESEYNYNNSYYKIIHIENILLNIYRIIKT